LEEERVKKVIILLVLTMILGCAGPKKRLNIYTDETLTKDKIEKTDK